MTEQRRELEERRERLFQALRELEEDRRAGRLTDADHATLAAKYEREAAAVLRELDALERGQKRQGRRAGETGGKARPGARGTEASPPATRLGRVALYAGGLLVFGGVAALMLAGSLRPRGPGGTITGTDIVAAERGGAVGEDDPLPALEARVAVDSGDLEALLALGHVYLARQRLEEAARLSLRALNIDQHAAEAHAHVAMIAASSGDVEFALEVLERVLVVEPDYPEALLFKGMILSADGRDRAGAVAALERYLVVTPEGADTARVRAMLDAARRGGG